MKPEPTTQLVTNSAGNAAHATATMMPANSNAAAINMGRRTPTRSIRRPTGTENVSGTSANSDSNMPTVNGEASSFNANSDNVTRHPAYARCSMIVNGSTNTSDDT